MDITFICISLKEREDRRKSITSLFERLKIKDKIVWWIVDKHPQGGIYGCFETHSIIWTSNEIKTKYVCVFEDDISIFESNKETVKRFKRFIKYMLANEIDCDLINLEPGSGYYGDKSIFFGSSSKDELRDGFTTRTGCYFAEKRKLERLAKRIKPSYGVDIDIALYGKCNMYSVVVPIFRQNKEFESDNTGAYHDYFGYPTNNGLEYSRNLLTTVPLFAYLYLNVFQASIDIYSSCFNLKKIDEMRDRRIEK